MVNVVQKDQHKIVKELTKRQDDALEQLDALNDRIEIAIKEVVDSRENEISDDFDSEQIAAAA